MVCKGGGTIMPQSRLDLETVRDHLARYAFAADFAKDRYVLDMACGSGYGSALLSDKGARMVVGGDMSIEAIEVAKKLYGRPKVEFILLDATNLPFNSNSFDVIASMETIEHLEQYRDYLIECKRILKPGGVFICSTPNRGHGIHGLKSFGPDHIHEFYIDELEGLLSQYFNEVELYIQGNWRRIEKVRVTIALIIKRIIQPINSYTPKLYELIRRFYSVISFGLSRIEPSEIANWDDLLDDEHKPSLLFNGALTPKTVVAIARK